MTDIVKRLNTCGKAWDDFGYQSDAEVCYEAADRIEAQDKSLAKKDNTIIEQQKRIRELEALAQENEDALMLSIAETLELQRKYDALKQYYSEGITYGQARALMECE